MDNAAWYHRFLASSPGWHSMGGKLTSGLGATTGTMPMPPPAVPTYRAPATYTVGLGSDSQLWMVDGNWHSYPPAFTGWINVLGIF